MRIHLLALPHCPTTKAHELDGFAMMTIRFARLLKNLGHTVILYGSDENEAPCDEFVTVIYNEEAQTLLGVNDTPYQYAYIEEWSPIYQLANARTIKAIGKRKEDRDFLCLIGGASQKSVADAHPDLMCVEYSIGYQGSFSPYRVFESHVWRHWTYGAQNIMDGRFFDTVIPCFFDEAEFPFQAQKEPFVLYVGRLIERKGIAIACRAAEAAGLPLRIIGHGNQELVTHGAEYLGALSMAERNQWMARAQAVICPTTYIEPFCCVSAEAQFCGTPVVATDWGGFVENIEPGVTGFRCTYLGEFATALREAARLDPTTIRRRAMARFSPAVVGPYYQAYFERLALLWDKGWETMTQPEAVYV
jgi:glycosyltransferase involved in cell wall biosynthesis